MTMPPFSANAINLFADASLMNVQLGTSKTLYFAIRSEDSSVSLTKSQLKPRS